MLGGALVGALCALLGIAVSLALGDVTAMLLLAGAASSAFAGAIGGAVARRFTVPRAAPATGPAL